MIFRVMMKATCPLGKMLSLDFSQDLFSHVFGIVVSGFSVVNVCTYVHVSAGKINRCSVLCALNVMFKF